MITLLRPSLDVDAQQTSIRRVAAAAAAINAADAGRRAIDCSIGAWLMHFLQHGLPGERAGDLLRRLHVQPPDHLQPMLRPVQLVRIMGRFVQSL